MLMSKQGMNQPADEPSWPEELSKMVYTVEGEFRQSAVSDQGYTRLSHVAIKAMALYFGGRAEYLPKIDALSRAVRDISIFQDRIKLSPKELSLKYDLSVMQILKVLERVRHNREKYGIND